MGCASSTFSPEEEAQMMQSRTIDKRLQLELDQKRKEASINVLLLGPGESGKSTILKQMKIIYKVGFSHEELQFFRATLIENVFQCVQTVVDAMERLQIPYDFINALETEPTGLLDSTPMQEPFFSQSTSGLNQLEQSLTEGVNNIAANKPLARRARRLWNIFKENGGQKGLPILDIIQEVSNISTVFGFSRDDPVPPGTAQKIQTIWYDTGVQYCLSRASEFEMNECCNYVISHIDRIFDPSFEPSEQDILQVRIKTVSVTETRIRMGGRSIVLFDLGGQKSERAKWAPYFQDAQAIIFVVAIGHYDMVIGDDAAINRVVDGISLFSTICNHPIFKNTDMILFLNKIDLFKEKLQTAPVKLFFPKYEGDGSYESSAKYFIDRFMSVNKNSERVVFPHLTWATDSKQIKKVLDSVENSLLRTFLKHVQM